MHYTLFFADVQTIHRIIWSGEWEEKKKTLWNFAYTMFGFLSLVTWCVKFKLKFFKWKFSLLLYRCINVVDECLWTRHIWIAHIHFFYSIYNFGLILWIFFEQPGKIIFDMKTIHSFFVLFWSACEMYFCFGCGWFFLFPKFVVAL